MSNRIDFAGQGMPYFYFSREELSLFIEHDLNKQAIRLYLYMRLNCDDSRAISRRLKLAVVADLLGVHRTTIMRAAADLEDAKLIVSRDTDHGETYDLPECARVRSVASETARKNKQTKAQRSYFAEKQNIEGVLNRRLSQPEKQRLREKYGLLS